MNVAEILRCAGYEIRRAKGQEWQEQLVDVLSAALVENPAEEKALMAEAVALCAEKTDNPLMTRWVMRDALDRAALRRAQSDVLKMYLA